jgi:hypothetical protein
MRTHQTIVQLAIALTNTLPVSPARGVGAASAIASRQCYELTVKLRE